MFVKVYGCGENGWLLMKFEDEYESKFDILKKDELVIFGKIFEKME